MLSPIVHLTVNSFNLLEPTSSLSYYNKLQYSITRRATTLYLVRSSRALAELARLSKVVDGTFSRIPWLVQGPSPLKAPLFFSCAAAHVSGSTYFESLFPPTTKATQGGPTTEAEVSSAIRYLYLRREPVGAPCTTCRWRLGCRLAMRCTTEGHNLVNFDSNLLDRPCCGNRDLDGPKFAFRGGCIWPGLAWPGLDTWPCWSICAFVRAYRATLLTVTVRRTKIVQATVPIVL